MRYKEEILRDLRNVVSEVKGQRGDRVRVAIIEDEIQLEVRDTLRSMNATMSRCLEQLEAMRADLRKRRE